MRIVSFLIFSLISTVGIAQIPNYLLYDANQSQGFGAENSITIHKYLTKASDNLIPIKFNEENSFSKKTLGITYRLAKLGLLDVQIDWLFMLTQHEIFGHGGRAREFGFKRNSYEINPAPPYGSGSGSATLGSLDKGEVYTVTENQSFLTGGNEANLVLSQSFSSRLLLGNKMHYREASLYLLTQNNQFLYIWRDYLASGGQGNFNGDVTRYVKLINSRFEGGLGIGFGNEYRYTLKRVANQSLISLLNPLQLYATYSVFKTYLIDGEATLEKLPMIKFATFKYLPAFNYNLTPFGGEFISNHYFVRSDQLYQLNLNYGDRIFFDFYGAGLRVFNIFPSSKVYLGAEIQGWSQPELQLDDQYERLVNEPRLGYLFKVDGSFFPFPKSNGLGLFTQLGYKTKGYALGETLDKSLIFKIGLAIRAN